MNCDLEARAPVRVLVVDDSAFMRVALSRMIAAEPDFEIAATASSGSDALDKISSFDPDVVTLDLEMPGLDGLQTLRRIMSRFPRPVIVVSASPDKGTETTFNALSAGAFDYVPKQLSDASLDIFHIRPDLIAKIRAAAASRKPLADGNRKKPSQSSSLADQYFVPSPPAVVAMGVSTGGPKALQEILPTLPRDLSVPILIVQHMPQGFTAPLAERLNGLCSLPVREASHREPVEPGVIYIAPAGTHMRVERLSGARCILLLDTEPADRLHMPSVDILMKSVAEAFRERAMGIIMTGMGCDGAEGMTAIHRAGGMTIGQDEASCIVYGMPRACAELGILTRVVPLDQIPTQILKATQYRMRA